MQYTGVRCCIPSFRCGDWMNDKSKYISTIATAPGAKYCLIATNNLIQMLDSYTAKE